ncbi:hypothetical protein BC332_03424 [Capsicum chinense]|nr:hypothetical protein BC332_03424 [Capsicum chinense]
MAAAAACTVHSLSRPRVASTSQCVPTLSLPNNKTISFPLSTRYRSNTATSKVTFSPFSTRAAKSDSSDKRKEEKQQVLEEEEEEVEEELPWIQEKALDLVEFTGSVTQAIPGPRVGRSSFPWILAVPLTYFGFTFVIAFVKTVRNVDDRNEMLGYSDAHIFLAMLLGLSKIVAPPLSDSPKCTTFCFIELVEYSTANLKFLISSLPAVQISVCALISWFKNVNKNAELCKTIDEFFEKGKDNVEPATLKELAQKMLLGHKLVASLPLYMVMERLL